MKRTQKTNIQNDMPGLSTSPNPIEKIKHNSIPYIYHRVELLQRVLYLVKVKGLKSMIPRHIKDLPLERLEAMSTEELLGLTSKRLCEVLNGPDPQSDTSSSSPEIAENSNTISDREIIGKSCPTTTTKKNKKNGKSKKKNKRSGDKEDSGDKCRKFKGRLTATELVELQAAAKEITTLVEMDKAKDQNNAPAADSSKSFICTKNEAEAKKEPTKAKVTKKIDKPSVMDLFGPPQIPLSAKGCEIKETEKKKKIFKIQEETFQIILKKESVEIPVAKESKKNKPKKKGKRKPKHYLNNDEHLKGPDAEIMNLLQDTYGRVDNSSHSESEISDASSVPVTNTKPKNKKSKRQNRNTVRAGRTDLINSRAATVAQQRNAHHNTDTASPQNNLFLGAMDGLPSCILT